MRNRLTKNRRRNRPTKQPVAGDQDDDGYLGSGGDGDPRRRSGRDHVFPEAGFREDGPRDAFPEERLCRAEEEWGWWGWGRRRRDRTNNCNPQNGHSHRESCGTRTNLTNSSPRRDSCEGSRRR